MRPLIDAELLQEKLGKVVILDARTGKDAHAAYLSGHIGGARFVDLETDLAAPADPAKGGRHPLPGIETFAARVGVLGIDPHDEVVVYDTDAGTNAAARCWWMLRSLGHKDVRVLDGGLDAAKRVGIPMESGVVPVIAKPPYPHSEWLWPVVDRATVAAHLHEPGWVIVDARSGARYRGESEPIDPVAGHIPSAVNVFHRDHLVESGLMRAPAALRAQLDPVITGRERVIASCGSGVTACHTILAMAQAGYEIPALYVGSWSEWCRNDLPREPA
jgi:thiosulfate/3-mercaptopyruvate sulfurtransferase